MLCLAISGSGDYCYSGSLDSAIHVWNVPNSNIDPYDQFDPEILYTTLHGHTNAVWGLSVLSSKQQLLSCSADGTIKLWVPHSEVSSCIHFPIYSCVGNLEVVLLRPQPTLKQSRVQRIGIITFADAGSSIIGSQSIRELYLFDGLFI